MKNERTHTKAIEAIFKAMREEIISEYVDAVSNQALDDNLTVEAAMANLYKREVSAVILELKDDASGKYSAWGVVKTEAARIRADVMTNYLSGLYQYAFKEMVEKAMKEKTEMNG